MTTALRTDMRLKATHVGLSAYFFEEMIRYNIAGVLHGNGKVEINQNQS